MSYGLDSCTDYKIKKNKKIAFLLNDLPWSIIITGLYMFICLAIGINSQTCTV